MAPPRDWQEGRRLRALELHDQGWTGPRIAEVVGVPPGEVSQWLERPHVGGREALRAQPPPSPAPQPGDEQREQLQALLARGAEAFDLVGEVWRTKLLSPVGPFVQQSTTAVKGRIS